MDFRPVSCLSPGDREDRGRDEMWSGRLPPSRNMAALHCIEVLGGGPPRAAPARGDAPAAVGGASRHRGLVVPLEPRKQNQVSRYKQHRACRQIVQPIDQCPNQRVFRGAIERVQIRRRNHSYVDSHPPSACHRFHASRVNSPHTSRSPHRHPGPEQLPILYRNDIFFLPSGE